MEINNKRKSYLVTLVLLLSFISVSCTLKSDLSNPYEPDYILPAPYDLRIIDINESSISLAWKVDINTQSDNIINNIRTVIELLDRSNNRKVMDTLKQFTTSITMPGKFSKPENYVFRACILLGTKIGKFSEPSNLNDFSFFPTFVFINYDAKAKKIFLKWDDNSSTETGFLLEKKISNEQDYSLLVNLPANSKSYYDMSITEMNAIYHYRIRAVFKDGTKSLSDTISLHIP